VKLWLQEKELKDIMSQKDKEIQQAIPPIKPEVILNKVSDNATKNESLAESNKPAKYTPAIVRNRIAKRPVNNANKAF
jgi:hypothetical protein